MPLYCQKVLVVPTICVLVIYLVFVSQLIAFLQTFADIYLVLRGLNQLVVRLEKTSQYGGCVLNAFEGVESAWI